MFYLDFVSSSLSSWESVPAVLRLVFCLLAHALLLCVHNATCPSPSSPINEVYSVKPAAGGCRWMCEERADGSMVILKQTQFKDVEHADK